MIAAGRVTVNGKVITELGTKVDPARDHVKVDGKHLSAAQPFVYLVLNNSGTTSRGTRSPSECTAGRTKYPERIVSCVIVTSAH